MSPTAEQPRPSRPRAVLWDLDGTLVDSEPLWRLALDEVATELGRGLTTQVHRDMIGTDDRTTMRILARHTGAHLSDSELDRLHDRVIDRVTGLLSDAPPVLPGAVAAVRGLRADGVPLALVTSSPPGIADIALSALGRDLFDVVVTAADVTARKPAPQPYLLATRCLNVPPSATWVVEDSPSGAEAAEAAGCVVLLAPGAVPAARAPGRVVLDALTDLAVGHPPAGRVAPY